MERYNDLTVVFGFQWQSNPRYGTTIELLFLWGLNGSSSMAFIMAVVVVVVIPVAIHRGWGMLIFFIVDVVIVIVMIVIFLGIPLFPLFSAIARAIVIVIRQTLQIVGYIRYQFVIVVVDQRGIFAG